MPRQRSRERDRARELWEADHTRPLKDIAAEVGASESLVRKWKCADKWDTVTLPIKSNVTKTDKKLIASVEANEELTDKQRAFCLYYVKTFNATTAYQKAYGCSYDTAAAHGWELLKNVAVRAEIARLKAMRHMDMLADVDDLVELHMRIAFADMRDFAGWGGSTVTLKSSDQVDGQLVKEVKEGREGVSIKLADQAKSRDFLERFFTANPLDRHKVEYDNARLEIERKKAEQASPDTDKTVTYAFEDPKTDEFTG